MGTSSNLQTSHSRKLLTQLLTPGKDWPRLRTKVKYGRNPQLLQLLPQLQPTGQATVRSVSQSAHLVCTESAA